MINPRIKKLLAKRKPDTHKGDYGHVFVLAGSAGLTGAAYLTAQAALLSGSGLVTLGIPKGLDAILSRKLTEVMTMPLPQTRAQSLSPAAFVEIKKFINKRKIDAIAIGPGLSGDSRTQQLIRKVVGNIKAPMVIDADALNALSGHLNILLSAIDYRPSTVITPHPGELARLLGTTARRIQADRKGIAKRVAKRYKVVVVLKGHRTVVAEPEGRLYINTTGNPGMASGGCGDVLTGMIASFIGQGVDAFEAAETGVELHGLAGDIAAGKVGQPSLKATDLLDNLHKAINSPASRRR